MQTAISPAILLRRVVISTIATLLIHPSFLPLLPSSVLRGQEPETPRPEHPRPDFERDMWLTLNGGWLFRTDPEDQGVPGEWFRHFDINE